MTRNYKRPGVGGTFSSPTLDDQLKRLIEQGHVGQHPEMRVNAALRERYQKLRRQGMPAGPYSASQMPYEETEWEPVPARNDYGRQDPEMGINAALRERYQKLRRQGMPAGPYTGSQMPYEETEWEPVPARNDYVTPRFGSPVTSRFGSPVTPRFGSSVTPKLGRAAPRRPARAAPTELGWDSRPINHRAMTIAERTSNGHLPPGYTLAYIKNAKYKG